MKTDIQIAQLVVDLKQRIIGMQAMIEILLGQLTTQAGIKANGGNIVYRPEGKQLRFSKNKYIDLVALKLGVNRDRLSQLIKCRAAKKALTVEALYYPTIKSTVRQAILNDASVKVETLLKDE